MKCPPTPKLMRDLSLYLLHLVPHLAFGGEALPHNTLTLPVIMVYFIIHCFRSKRAKWSWTETFKQWTKKKPPFLHHLILSQWQKASWHNKRKYSKDGLGCQPLHNRVHVGVLRAVFTMQSQNQDFSKGLKHPSAVQAITPQSTGHNPWWWLLCKFSGCAECKHWEGFYLNSKKNYLRAQAGQDYYRESAWGQHLLDLWKRDQF